MEKTELAVCLYCHEKSLWFNKANNSFECLNLKCSNYNVPISLISFDRNNQQIEAEKKALDESTAKARLWNGNQYWDEKKKKWRNGDQPVRIRRFPSWVVIIGICIVISIAITIILNYLHPGTRYSFFIW
jgi:hypothetical protein